MPYKITRQDILTGNFFALFICVSVFFYSCGTDCNSQQNLRGQRVHYAAKNTVDYRVAGKRRGRCFFSIPKS